MRAWFALTLALSMLGCNDETVEDVPQDVCVSGKRWIGGRRGSEEMYPGRDCVGCHLENDGPQLMAGGTVYGFSQGREGAFAIRDLGKPQSTDCFGVEGIKVTIVGDDLEEFTTTTNRAGNFFFEGRPDELAKPIFSARIEFTVVDTPGGMPRDISIAMTTRPSYGGCARCHSPYVVPTDPLPAPPYPPETVVSFAQDYIDQRLPVTEFLDGSTASAGPVDDAAHDRSVAEIEDFVHESTGH
jgi:hypothetical protein